MVHARRQRVAEAPKRRNRAKGPDALPGRHPRREAERLAVSTGEAARHCLVSADTIANWIAVRRLPAQRTCGGQYRIWVDDLRAFMEAHGMRTDSLDRDLGLAPACWEFWAATDPRSASPSSPSSCVDCPVRRSHAEDCYLIRPLLPGGPVRARSCVECAYFLDWRRVR
jgi:excisionase family DNA binding protein